MNLNDNIVGFKNRFFRRLNKILDVKFRNSELSTLSMYPRKNISLGESLAKSHAYNPI